MSAYIPTKRWRKRQKNLDKSSGVGENEVKTNLHVAKETKSKIHFYQPPGVMSGGFLDTATYNPEEKTVYMTFSSTQEEKVLHWILSQGADIEPLEPAAFVEKWKKRVLAMYSLIQGN